MRYTFDNIAGYKKEKEELEKIYEMLINRDKYLNKGEKIPKSIIFYGEAGTGKTLFSKVLAFERDLITYKIDIDSFDSGKEVCKKIRKAFKKARKCKVPSMIFFDDLDKLLKNDKENYYNDQAEMILSQLLTLIDGLNCSKDVIFVATCNSNGCLKDRLVYLERIDKKITLDKPTFESRVDILNFYANKTSCKFEITMEEIAKLCSGFSCSALRSLINELTITSNENNFVSKELIVEKVNKIKNEGVPKETLDMEDTIDACRNIGYFLVARTFNKGKYVLNMEDNNVCNNFFSKILAKYDDNFIDYDDEEYYDDYDDYDYCHEDDAFDSEEKRFNDGNNDNEYYCKADLLNAISVLYGGYIAETVVLNKTYDNIQGLFSTINSLLLNMSKQGMFGIENAYSLKSEEMLKYPSEFKNKLDKIFEDTLSKCYQVAERIINNNKDLIERLIPILVDEGYMNNFECEPILEELGGIKA